MRYLDDKTPRSLTALSAAVIFGCVSAHPGLAQNVFRSDGPIACGNFQRGPKGSWTVLRRTTMSPPRGAAEPGAAANLRNTSLVSGIEVTTVLDRNCGYQGSKRANVIIAADRGR